MMKWSNVIILPPSSWLITLGNGAILDILHWFQLLADWALTSSYNQVSLGEWMSTLLCPCIPPSLLPWPHYSWAHQAMTRVAGGKVTDTNKMSHIIHFCWGHWWWALIRGRTIFISCYRLERTIHIPCPDILVTHFLIAFFPNPQFWVGARRPSLKHPCCSVIGRRFVLWSGNRSWAQATTKRRHGGEPSSGSSLSWQGNKFFTDEGVRAVRPRPSQHPPYCSFNFCSSLAEQFDVKIWIPINGLKNIVCFCLYRRVTGTNKL